MSDSRRILQLEKMVSGLLDRIVKSKALINQKNIKIEKYEAYFMKLKASANREHASQLLGPSPCRDYDAGNMLLSSMIDSTGGFERRNSLVASRLNVKSSATLTMERAWNHGGNVR